MGRPRTDALPLTVRVYPNQIAALDAWISMQPDPKPTRPEVIRLALSDWLNRQGILSIEKEESLK